MVVGRHPTSEIVLENAAVSRQHAQVTRTRLGVFHVQDLRSRNGTIVNGTAIKAPMELSDGDEIRIWSTAAKHSHGMGAMMEARNARAGSAAITLHTLRKDGFTYLSSTGAWAHLISKPLMLRGPGLTLNASAPKGEVRSQVTDVEGRPIPGFAFDDCREIVDADSTAFELSWKGDWSRVAGKPVRLELRWLNGRIYALRGDWHFLDAQDWHLLEDGREIDPRWFDY